MEMRRARGKQTLRVTWLLVLMTRWMVVLFAEMKRLCERDLRGKMKTLVWVYEVEISVRHIDGVK